MDIKSTREGREEKVKQLHAAEGMVDIEKDRMKRIIHPTGGSSNSMQGLRSLRYLKWFY